MAASRFHPDLFWQGLVATDHESPDVVRLADPRVLRDTRGDLLILERVMSR